MDSKKDLNKKEFIAAESFLKFINDLSPTDKSKFSLLKNSIFIPEDRLKFLLTLYQQWLIDEGAGNYSFEKLNSRIFGDDQLELYYLPKGNACEIGFLARLSNEGHKGLSNFPSLSLMPISARDYLHPRDKSIEEITGVELRRHSNQALKIVFNIKERELIASEPFVRKLAQMFRASKKVSERYPQLNLSLKDSLVVLHTILISSRSDLKRRLVLIPEKFKNDSEIEILASSLGFMFILKDNKLLEAYESRGRGLTNFISSEIVYLKELGISGLDGIQFLPEDRFVLAKLKITGKWFGIERRALSTLVEKIYLSRWFRGKLPKRFSVKDVLEHLNPALKNADWIDISQLGRQQEGDPKRREKPRRELKFTPWTFKTGKNYTIVEFVEGGNFARDQKQKF